MRVDFNKTPRRGFLLPFSISLMGGLIIAFPIIGYQMWRFVAPGLYKSEKGAFLPFLLASPVMFFLVLLLPTLWLRR